jgi:hypothetical protein
MCQECERIHKFCEEKEPEYVKEFAGEVVGNTR